jgi:hypothetical protein
MPVQRPNTEMQSPQAQSSGIFSFRRGQEYYTTYGRKVLDVVIGFFLPVIVSILFALLSIATSFFPAPVSILWLVSVVAYIVLIPISFIYGRRYLGIGLLMALIIPLLIFGACLLFLIPVM